NVPLIGEVAVASGQAMGGDPCNLDDWKPWDSETVKFEEHKNKAGEYGYLGACEATIGKGFGQLGGASAVAFSTGYGDGLYPVYAHINEDGRVGLIVIDFTGEYNVSDD
ncbi:MAG: DUF4241 domain-containing protein, partial [bacterium]